MIPPPPRSPLFPYTTLFRSEARVDPRSELREATVQRDLGAACGSVRDEHPAHAPGVVEPEAREERLRDRKSTRLNSSHRCISYAVFCLKKKKKKTKKRKKSQNKKTKKKKNKKNKKKQK